MAQPAIRVDGSIAGAGVINVDRDVFVGGEVLTLVDTANPGVLGGWVLLAQPESDTITLSDPAAESPTLTLPTGPDRPGTYIVTRTVGGLTGYAMAAVLTANNSYRVPSFGEETGVYTFRPAAGNTRNYVPAVNDALLKLDAAVGGGGGSALTIEDDGTPLTTDATKINFAGDGVATTEPVADEVLVTISGAPQGAAGGDLSGTYPNPTVNAIAHSATTGQTANDHHAQVHDFAGADHNAATLAQVNGKISDATLDDQDDPRPADEIITTSGPTTMPVGAIADGEYLARSGANIVGVAPDPNRVSRGDYIAVTTAANQTPPWTVGVTVVEWDTTVESRGALALANPGTQTARITGLKANRTYAINCGISTTHSSFHTAAWSFYISGVQVFPRWITRSSSSNQNDSQPYTGHYLFTPTTDSYLDVRSDTGLTATINSDPNRHWLHVYEVAQIYPDVVQASGATYVVQVSDDIVEVDPAVTTAVTLPAPAAADAGRLIRIKNTENDTTTVTVTPASGNIDGAANKTITTAYGGFTCYHNGTDYFTI